MTTTAVLGWVDFALDLAAFLVRVARLAPTGTTTGTALVDVASDML